MKKKIIFISLSLAVCMIFNLSLNIISAADGGYTTNLSTQTESDNESVVYMTKGITPEALMKIYEKLEFTPIGNVAVKLSTGEAGNTHYLDPNLIKDLVQSVDGTIVECNTAYGGSRSSTAMHKQVAADHGFTAIADVDIMDENGSIHIPVSDKAKNLKYDIVGSNYSNYNSMIVLSHFKGHSMGGFGGAIKNISIGIGSSRGKTYIHSGGHSETSWGGGTQDQFLESMAEAAQAVHNDKQNNGGIAYISIMNHLSVDCDCDGNPANPKMNDVGILASYDPVALDQACVDIVYNTDRSESGDLINRIESRNGQHTLEYAQTLRLGNRKYNLIDIDEEINDKLYIRANGTEFEADLVKNSSVDALVELLKQGDITIDMRDYSNFEKVGSLGVNLPRNDEYITTEAGDLILYQGNQFVIYYDTNSWSFTRLGKIKNVTKTDLLEVFGNGNVTVTLSLNKKVVYKVMGDADNDGVLTASDAAFILHKVRFMDFKTPVENAGYSYNVLDVTNDGKLTATDAVTVLQKVLNNSFIMPCEK